MTKLERKALKAYPNHSTKVVTAFGTLTIDKNIEAREAYIDGYKQAIEDACKWLRKNCTYTHPRKGTEECIVNIPRFKTGLISEE